MSQPRQDPWIKIIIYLFRNQNLCCATMGLMGFRWMDTMLLIRGQGGVQVLSQSNYVNDMLVTLMYLV